MNDGDIRINIRGKYIFRMEMMIDMSISHHALFYQNQSSRQYLSTPSLRLLLQTILSR